MKMVDIRVNKENTVLWNNTFTEDREKNHTFEVKYFAEHIEYRRKGTYEVYKFMHNIVDGEEVILSRHIVIYDSLVIVYIKKSNGIQYIQYYNINIKNMNMGYNLGAYKITTNNIRLFGSKGKIYTLIYEGEELDNDETQGSVNMPMYIFSEINAHLFSPKTELNIRCDTDINILCVRMILEKCNK